ncbi:MAG: triose-phosphate isomerase [Rheinheimera sp.]|uniref:triose-phosphate isomerase n=1 Tax=Arsukibacterium sp. UBA3155 TaxID=1946058 RepID=UPI000C8AA25F|nr:triose-phosphate isomerase [Arsukibacterium sp. UBA3155]MAD75317.1 triose-phosphate isomerase [Rheinheimera sp.]|tara:strand:+ start:136207 stop:136944 length:738 start_codon:yes stop_codon:yes gene_type:complete
MSAKKLIAANWKMNGSRALVETVSQQLTTLNSEVDVLICPPATLLAYFPVSEHYSLGAQDISEHAEGAYTGELSGSLINEAGASFVLVGHSERRQYHAETDQLVCAKIQQAIAAGLTPVLCIGETLAERQQENTEQVIAKQLAAVYASHPELLAKSVIAYEPVWAIGTGESASPEQAQETHAFIRRQLTGYNSEAAAKVRILYGGSVNAANCQALFTQADIDGALVGGASLKPAEFLQICQSAKD